MCLHRFLSSLHFEFLTSFYSPFRSCELAGRNSETLRDEELRKLINIACYALQINVGLFHLKLTRDVDLLKSTNALSVSVVASNNHYLFDQILGSHIPGKPRKVREFHQRSGNFLRLVIKWAYAG